MDGDTPLAQLLGMGFVVEEIERCQVAMATSFRPFSLQEATVVGSKLSNVSSHDFHLEKNFIVNGFWISLLLWRLLEQQCQSSVRSPSSGSRLVLTLPPGPSSYSTAKDFQRPVSSSKDLSSSSSQELTIKSKY